MMTSFMTEEGVTSRIDLGQRNLEVRVDGKGNCQQLMERLNKYSDLTY